MNSFLTKNIELFVMNFYIVFFEESGIILSTQTIILVFLSSNSLFFSLTSFQDFRLSSVKKRVILRAQSHKHTHLLRNRSNNLRKFVNTCVTSLKVPVCAFLMIFLQHTLAAIDQQTWLEWYQHYLQAIVQSKRKRIVHGNYVIQSMKAIVYDLEQQDIFS